MQITEHHGGGKRTACRRFLEKPEFEKHLGMVVSSDLSWTTQAEKSRKKLEVFSGATNERSPKSRLGSQGKTSTAATFF